ncbi:tetratricopeptide repeat protein [Lapillicoccus jejuensis]|uniref:Tetratricopeptide repeat protein n=1 Tax=Lapillicoccus jejuensis TaxID=402171 RepID=A0A542E5I7_9MICO|nr:hypothetical protein [Lapillicoccus jejuensis]TQJ10603.1 hypothetical protein FB458_3732 [Lapillicoccus jejuensis]
MTTLTSPPTDPFLDGPDGSDHDGPPPETPQARSERLARRRRLVVWSLPVVLVVLAVALKLLTMVALGQQARSAWDQGNITSLQSAGDRLGFLDLIERHKAPFARGDAKVLAGDLDGARAQFERALSLAPADGLENCQIRVNLAAALEKLGDAARSSSGGLAAATPYYDREQEVAAAAPPGCFQPGGQGTGQQLDQAQQRARDKSRATPSQPGQDQQQGEQGQQPDPSKEQQLDQKTKENQQQRDQGAQGQRDSGSDGLPHVDKPW